MHSKSVGLSVRLTGLYVLQYPFVGFSTRNRPNNCDFVGKSRTARPTFPGPRELRVIFCLNFSDGPEENPEDGEKSDASSDFLIVFHGTVALIEFTSRSF